MINYLLVRGLVVDMLRYCYSVLVFSVFLGGCNGGIFGLGVGLRGMDVLIVSVMHFVTVVYVGLHIWALIVGFDSGGQGGSG